MFKRKIEPLLRKTVNSFPVTVLTGPRQSGKTTLLKMLYPEYYYINLEYPDELALMYADPRGVINTNLNQGIIVDEAQRFPEIFSYIQATVDEVKNPGGFILSGSQNFLLMNKVSQSLAGRAAILELFPLSLQEYLTHEAFSKVPPVWEWLYTGTYPRPYQEHIDIKLWYNSYIQTYLERDVRDLLKVHDLIQFRRFLKLCAGRHGQLLNLSQLAIDAGISHATARQWIDLLETSYIVFLLPPYYKNYSKRVIKTPKLYFYDSAIVCQLLGIDSAKHLSLHSSRGAIFEGYIISEMIKNFYHEGRRPSIYFWRDSHGLEIDCLIEQGENLFAFEIKSTMTFRPDLLRGLKKWAKISNTPFENCQLIYAGDQEKALGDIKITPWAVV